jgi:dTDP-4-dehydrorhamnose reductase
MLGHQVCRVFSPRHELFGTCRGRLQDYPGLASVLPSSRCLEGFSLSGDDPLDPLLQRLRPAVVINCIGIVKQKKDALDPLPSIRVNALFPHQAAAACARHDARFVQISTDCVFSGRRGLYTEDDLPDPVDLYGRTKLLGEVTAPPHLTLRTSIIGWELNGRAGGPVSGLLEWFYSARRQTVRGFRRAIFSGLTTRALALCLAQTLESHPSLTGLFHLASRPIDKFSLLTQIAQALQLPVTIEPDDLFVCDRSLDAARFVAATGLRTPGWDDMIDGLAREAAELQIAI